MSIKQQAALHGLSRQAYQKRLKNWQRATVNGKQCLINVKHCMELNYKEVKQLTKDVKCKSL